MNEEIKASKEIQDIARKLSARLLWFEPMCHDYEKEIKKKKPNKERLERLTKTIKEIQGFMLEELWEMYGHVADIINKENEHKTP